MDKSPEGLWKKFSEVAARGDEQKARDFLIEHLEEFPQEEKDEILAAFFQEALERKASDLQVMKQFKKRGLDAIKELEAGKRKITDKEKLLELKKNL